MLSVGRGNMEKEEGIWRGKSERGEGRGGMRRKG